MSKVKIDFMQKVKEDWDMLQEEFNGTSDRAAVVVGGSILDEIMKDILKAHLVPFESNNEENKLFGFGSAIGSFSNRITLSYRLGLISKSEENLLNKIRDIRNDFAHGLATASFKKQSLKDKALNLSIDRRMLVPEKIEICDEMIIPEIKKADESDPRAIFQESVLQAVAMMRSRQCSAALTQLKKCKPFETAEGISAHIYYSLDEQIKNMHELNRQHEKKYKESDNLLLKHIEKNEALKAEVLEINKRVVLAHEKKPTSN